MERFNVLFLSRPEETEFFLNLIKFRIWNVKLECQLDFIVMNFVEQSELNRTREIQIWWNLQLITKKGSKRRKMILFLISCKCPYFPHIKGENNFTVTGYQICPHTLSVVRIHWHLPGAGDRRRDPILHSSLCQEELERVMVSLSTDIPVLRKKEILQLFRFRYSNLNLNVVQQRKDSFFLFG